ncbi:hypothetical protein COCNU_09G000990 [Cocos nucifera]|uniref:Uncharacterized protein n=1 Tax=Cocos nucifera TaxID=13894 RepID=A0A8K0IJJ7_COCNU|nr:hypothetical protein COCNU_09G000990 [Cocos nucifera]
MAQVGKAKLLLVEPFGNKSNFSLPLRHISFKDLQMCHYVATFANMIRDFCNETYSTREKCREAKTTMVEVKNAATKAKLASEAVEAEVQRLKQMLDKVEGKLALKKKKVIKAKKEMVEKFVEPGRLAVEAFKSSEELSNEKI